MRTDKKVNCLPMPNSAAADGNSRRLKSVSEKPERVAVRRLLPVACVLVALVDASGATRGEVGRLWIPFMPLLFISIWSAPALFGNEPLTFSRHARDGVVVGALSALWCVTLRLYWLI